MCASLLIKPLDAFFESNGMGWLTSVINIIAAFALACIAQRIVRRVLSAVAKRRMARMQNDETAARRFETGVSIIGGACKYVFYFIAVAIAAGELGLAGAMTSMLAAAGIGTLALGIGAQSLIGDVTTGFFMLFEDQMAVGDYVVAAGVEGVVEEITLRTVTIRGFKGEKNIIPNGQIKTITNYSRADYLAVVEMDVSREADAARALDIMLEEMQSVYAKLDDPRAKPPEKIGIVGEKDNGVTLRVTMSADAMQQWYIQREVIFRARERFRLEGIEAPYDRLRIMENEAKKQ